MFTPNSGVALVTGASRGIGRAIALRLAEQGASVACNFVRSQIEADNLVSQIQERGGQAAAFRADISNPASAARLVEEVESLFGHIAILVNNAGVTRDRLLIQMSEDDWDVTWRTDLAGLRAASYAVLPFMQTRGYGRIINLSSVVGVTGNAGQANYASAKSAVLGFTRALAESTARHGITVNCVIPGYIETDATSHLSEEQRAAWIRKIPMARAAGVDDVAEAVLFFAGPTTSYISGQCLAVDGGLLAAAGGGLAS